VKKIKKNLPLPGFKPLCMSRLKKGAAVVIGVEPQGQPSQGEGKRDRSQMLQTQPSGREEMV
jgi:hypothetical protein